MNKEIALNNISLANYDNNQRVEILHQISLNIPKKSIYTIVGPSGSGKSTLLFMINRLIEPDEGDIYIDDINIRRLNVIQLRRKVGLVFQNPTLLPVTVAENIMYGPKLAGIEDENLAKEMIMLVGLNEDFLLRDIENLSGGEKQRVAIARAIANKPTILLLDEPTSALDPNATEEIEKLIQGLNHKLEITVVWVTHDMEQAKRVGNYTMLLVNGRKVEDKMTKDFFENPQSLQAKEFLSKI